MPVSCAYQYCHNSEKNYTTEDGRKPSFFRFPRSASIRKLWVKNLGQEGFEPKPRTVLCSEHFKKSCFTKKTDKNEKTRIRIRSNAVPTLFIRDGVMKEIVSEHEEDDDDDDVGNGGQESWSGWHSWSDSEEEEEGQTEEDRQKEAAKGLKELEDLIDEDEEDEEVEEEEDEEVEEEDDDEGDDEGGNGLEMECSEKQEDEKDGDIVQIAEDIAQPHDKLTLDNVTMDSSLASVRVGQERMVSMTFQDILNSLISSGSGNSANSHPDKDMLQVMRGKSTQRVSMAQKTTKKRKSKQTKSSNPTSHSLESRLDEVGDDNSSGQGSTSVFEEGHEQNMTSACKDSPENITTTTTKMVPANLSTKLAGLKAKRAARGRSFRSKEGKMVLSIYRANTMMRIISAKDLPYVCGICGMAFTHSESLKLHAAGKHGYIEPTQVKKNGEIVSQVVIHRDFSKENLRTKAKVKELQKKYQKTEQVSVNRPTALGHKETHGQVNESINQSSVRLPDSDGDSPAPLADDGDDSDDSSDDVPGASASSEMNQGHEAKKKNKTNNGPRRHTPRDKCTRCPRYFKSIFQRNLHMAKEHGEFTTQIAAEWSSKKESDDVTVGEILQCAICPTFFTSQENAEEHLKKHCGMEGIKCDVCTEAIQMWKDGRNAELGDLLKRYRGITGDEDGGAGMGAETGNRSSALGVANGDNEEGATDLTKRTLEQLKDISNKNFFILTCLECNEQFFLRHHLNSHYKTHEKYTCKECGKELMTMTEYQDHMEFDHKIGICPCLYCPRKFPSLGKLNYHMLGHLGLFQCLVCGNTFMSKQSLMHHVKSQACESSHKPSPKDQPTKYSSSNPFMPGTDLKHFSGKARNRRPAKVKDIQCKFCDRTFTFAHNLRKHIRFQHPNEEVPWAADGFMCDQCGTVLASKVSLKIHLKTHATLNIPCPKPGCSSMFADQTKLKAHLHMHVPNTCTPTGRYRCDLCNRTYKSKQALSIHIMRHNGAEPHCCSYCGRTFMNVTHMVYHIRRNHTGQLDHKCEVCGKAYADPSTLKVHRLIHSSERPYKCESCSKDFPTEQYLRAHSRVHTRPFKCTECGEGFANHSAKRSHMHRQHGMPIEAGKNNRYTVERIDPELQSERSSEIGESSLDSASVEDMNATEAMVISETNEEQREMISQILTNFY